MSFVLPPDLTAAQAGIWLDQQLFPGKPIYNTGQVLSIRGKLRVELFEIALRETIAESPNLRLPPRLASLSPNLKLVDLRGEKDPHATAEQWIRAEMRKVIPLGVPALFEHALIRVGEDHTLWFQKAHHIIIDATGRCLLSGRTAARYRALRFDEPLPALNATTPEELLNAERRYASSNVHKVDRAYWLERFAHWPGPLLETGRQNTDRARSGVPARMTFTLPRSDFAHLETAARALGSTAFRAIIALTYAAFARSYGRYDIVLGVELANRSDARTKQVIGLMARPLPMLLTLNPATTIAEVVRVVEKSRTLSYPHRHFPLQELVRELGITRKGYHGLFDIIVNYIPLDYEFAFEKISVEHTNLSHGFTAPWVVTIEHTGSAHDIEVSIDTDAGLISADMAARLTVCMETLLLRGLDDPACQLASLPIMPETTKAQVLGLAAGQTVTLPERATLATLFTAQADRTPDAIALISREHQLTYATLHERATLLALRLAALGVRPGVIVGVALPRTPALVTAVLAVHMAGGAYLALDPAYPAERIRFMVTDAAASIILTDATLGKVFADTGARLLLVSETGVPKGEPVQPIAPAPAQPIAPAADDLAYVLYTSGSTGQPKAVGIEHRNLINLISWGRSVVSDAELRGVLFSTSLNFDLSAFEIFLPLVFGGCIILMENLLDLQSSSIREKVRLVNTGPSLFAALLRANGLPPGVTTAILAGERLSRRLADAVFEAAPDVRLLNCYGPTETTVYSSWALVDPTDRLEPTIGRPIWNTTFHVLDGSRALVPPGAEGELFIGGVGVGRGYLARIELTAERFVPNPYGPGRLYRTGDRVRWRLDGELEYLGRTDDQLKINGVRVEPGEIEAALLALPGISAAAVKLNDEPDSFRRLIAYLVPSAVPAPTTETVRSALERQLPPHMIPSSFVWLSAMPLTPNGKLDRKALPVLPREGDHLATKRPPKAGLECELAKIWEDLLQLSPIDTESDFFDLGGDSLALLSMFAAIESRFGRRLTVDALVGGLTVAKLAQLLAHDEPLRAEMDPVVALQPEGHLPPFFCVHGIGGDVVNLHRLAVHMGKQRPFFGIRRTSAYRLTDSVCDMAARYVAAMLKHQPSGPFYLGGYSFGAAVAYEIARQLVEQGHQIGLLAMIDQHRPGLRLTLPAAIAALPRMLPYILARMRDELAQVPPADRFREMQRLLLLWSKTALGFRGDAVSMFGVSPNETELRELVDANLRALRDYRPIPARIPITLFRAEVPLLTHCAMDRTLGWGELTGRDVRVRVVSGNHGSMVSEPLVRQLAKALSDELDARQGFAIAN
jgi:amino acid adenylation domain-containing protein